MSVRAYVLINVSGEKAKKVAEALGKIKGVSNAHAVTGPYDVIALVEAEDLEAMGDLILTGVRSTPGVSNTLTSVAVDTD